MRTYGKAYDFLVIGSIAGLSHALDVSRYWSVCVVTKKYADDSAYQLGAGRDSRCRRA